MTKKRINAALRVLNKRNHSKKQINIKRAYAQRSDKAIYA